MREAESDHFFWFSATFLLFDPFYNEDRFWAQLFPLPYQINSLIKFLIIIAVIHILLSYVNSLVPQRKGLKHKYVVFNTKLTLYYPSNTSNGALRK